MKMNWTKACRTRLTLITATALSLSLAACGTSSSGGDTTKGPVKIALVYPTSGTWASQGTNSVNGAQLAIADINKRGGVLGGRKLEAVVADAGNSPESAASTARRLLQGDDISALLGAYLSSDTLTISTVAEQKKIPNITQSFSDKLVGRGYQYTFKTTPTAKVFSDDVFKYLTEMYKAAGKPVPTVAILCSDDASGQQQYAAAVASAPQAGFKTVLNAQFPANITDTTSLVNRINSAKPQLLLLNGPDLAEIQIVKSLRGGGYTQPIVGLGGAGVTTQNFADQLGSAADGVFATQPWNGDLSPQAKPIAADYLKKYGGTFMPGESGTAYAGAWIAAEAIDQAKSADPKRIATALRSLTLTDGPATIYPGGKIKFDSKGLNTEAFPVMTQYQGKVPVTVWPQSVATAKPKL